MREAAYIIQNVTDTCLIVLDELGKGKSSTLFAPDTRGLVR